MKLLWGLVLLLTTVAMAAPREKPIAPSRRTQRAHGELSYTVINLPNVRNETQPLLTGQRGIQGAGPRGIPGAGPRIVGGHEATPCQFPYQAAVYIHTMDFRLGFCGGSLVSDRLVLTAAHCVFDKFYKVEVYLGIHNIERDAGIKRLAERVFLHARYDDDHLEYDIALLGLDVPVTTDECISPIDLDAEGCGTGVLDGVVATASGWGLIDDNENVADVLRWVDVTVIPNTVCEKTYGSMLESHMCSTSTTESAQGLCSGDSGGPLVHKDTGKQIGINSFVHIQGCESNNPSGYSRVSCFIDWINLVKTL